MAIRDCGYIPSECFSRFCSYYLIGIPSTPLIQTSRTPVSPKQGQKARKTMASCMPGSPEVHSRCFPVILHEVYFKIRSLHLLVCVCVCVYAHARASLYSTAHTWRSETTCRLPSLPTMGFQDGTQISDFDGKHPYLQNYFTIPIIYFETAFLTEPELTNLIRPSCPVNSRDPVSASSSYWN